MLDASLRLTFRNFATLFLVVATVTVPLHVAASFVHRDTVALSELQPAIEDFPPRRKIKGVGPPELDAARKTTGIVTILEIALLVPAIGATRRVLGAAERGHLPGVLDAWGHSVASLGRRPAAPRGGPVEAGAGLLLAAATGYAVYRIGLPLVETTPGAVRFGPAGVLDGAARAFGAPFLLVPLALLGRATKDVSGARTT
jgi:hypothetical protein